MKNWLIKKLGGYTNDEVLTEVVKDLYNTIDDEDILKENRLGEWVVNGKPLLEDTKKQLIAEAQMFLKTKLWKVLQTDIKYKANKKMFVESQTAADLVGGKLWLFTLDAFSTRLESLSMARGVFNTKKKDDAR